MDIVVPSFPGVAEMSGGGTSAVEAEVGEWLVDDGERVVEGQDTIELALDKVTFLVPAPASGVLRHRADVGDIVQPGDVVAVVDPS
jgi:2-oxoglutarate dehydrogenase E2 component (dihydrolipoamide succinyltransferase)